jgi:hypothetical protein
MFCKECGTENLDAQYECLNCKNIINTNFPLNGIERLSIIGFFTLTFLSILLFGFGIIPLIICLSIIYIIKKDRNFKYINNVKKFILFYLITLSLPLLLISYDENKREFIRLLLGFAVIPLGLFLFYWLFNNLFFNILKRHEQWIIENGLFTDLRNEKLFIEKTTEKIQTIKKEPINVTDELLKWADLKEKSLITEEEFQKAKEKILEGKL